MWLKWFLVLATTWSSVDDIEYQVLVHKQLDLVHVPKSKHWSCLNILARNGIGVEIRVAVEVRVRVQAMSNSHSQCSSITSSRSHVSTWVQA